MGSIIDPVQAIQQGSFYAYNKNLRIYTCPKDQTGHMRTYSINSMLNGSANENTYPALHPMVLKYSQILHPPPSLCMSLIDENVLSINDGMFALDVDKPDEWKNLPSTWHNRGDTLAFADGHAERWKWLDPRTLTIIIHWAVTPNNVDLQRLDGAISSQ